MDGASSAGLLLGEGASSKALLCLQLLTLSVEDHLIPRAAFLRGLGLSSQQVSPMSYLHAFLCQGPPRCCPIFSSKGRNRSLTHECHHAFSSHTCEHLVLALSPLAGLSDHPGCDILAAIRSRATDHSCLGFSYDDLQPNVGQSAPDRCRVSSSDLSQHKEPGKEGARGLWPRVCSSGPTCCTFSLLLQCFP